MKITIKQLKALIKEQVRENASKAFFLEEGWSNQDEDGRPLGSLRVGKGEHTDFEGEDSLQGTFTLTIELGNEDMKDLHDIAAVLSHLEQELRSLGAQGDTSGTARDVNGNRVGRWNIIED